MSKLYKKHKPVVSLPLLTSLAIAASLLLLIGFVWMKNQPSNSGELAEVSIVTLNKLDDINQFEDKILENKTELSAISSAIAGTNEIKIANKHKNHYQKNKSENILNNAGKAVIANKTESSSQNLANYTGNIGEISLNDVSKVTPNESFKIKADVQQQQLEYFAFSSINTAIIETTIEIGVLQTNISNENLAMTEKKEERKKAFKENVRYVFQNALLPEGVALAINN